MEQTLNRWDALQLIDEGLPVDIVFSTADRRRGTGGEIKRLKGVVKFKGTEPVTRLPKQLVKQKNLQRNPNHSEWKTFNVYDPNHPALHPYKVHWRLMHFLNGKRIIG